MNEQWIWTCPRKGFKIELDASNKLGFYGANFGDPVLVGTYASTTHFSDNGVTTDLCDPHVNSVVPVDIDVCRVNGKLVNVKAVRKGHATLKITMTTDTPCTTFDTKFYPYNGAQRDVAPEGVKAAAFEVGDKCWRIITTEDPLQLAAQNYHRRKHVWYIALAVLPTTSGVKTGFAFTIETNMADGDTIMSSSSTT